MKIRKNGSFFLVFFTTFYLFFSSQIVHGKDYNLPVSHTGFRLKTQQSSSVNCDLDIRTLSNQNSQNYWKAHWVMISQPNVSDQGDFVQAGIIYDTQKITKDSTRNHEFFFAIRKNREYNFYIINAPDVFYSKSSFNIELSINEENNIEININKQNFININDKFVLPFNKGIPSFFSEYSSKDIKDNVSFTNCRSKDILNKIWIDIDSARDIKEYVLGPGLQIQFENPNSFNISGILIGENKDDVIPATEVNLLFKKDEPLSSDLWRQKTNQHSYSHLSFRNNSHFSFGFGPSLSTVSSSGEDMLLMGYRGSIFYNFDRENVLKLSFLNHIIDLEKNGIEIPISFRKYGFFPNNNLSYFLGAGLTTLFNIGDPFSLQILSELGLEYLMTNNLSFEINIWISRFLGVTRSTVISNIGLGGEFKWVL